mmetsp:Transcript_16274/g.38453  ORF Transcript_16274/g.38453 Transcript_16274/m.38453 type:complete len:168 (+) Transcript_16274:2585-3088(+)
MTALIAFSLKRSNIIFMDPRPDPELFDGATGPLTAPAIELPRKDEPLEEMLPEELALQAPARTMVFLGAVLGPRTGTAAANETAAEAATKAHAALVVAASFALDPENGALARAFMGGSRCPVRVGCVATKAPVRGTAQAAKINPADSATILDAAEVCWLESIAGISF